MRSIALRVVAIGFLIAALPVAAGEAPHLDWSQLMDQSVQSYDDPYRELARDQLISLVTVARLREKAERGEFIDEDRLSVETASLTAAGIDVDNLIAQRWVVAERRERAATSGNKEVDGREVMLSGFAIPAPMDDDGTATAYLVAERGMCSHMPPPSPNQMVRLRLPDHWRPQAIYEPVRVSGLLSIAPTTRMVRVVDGLVPMRATFTMNVSSVETPGSLRGAEVSQHMASKASHSRGSAKDKHKH